MSEWDGRGLPPIVEARLERARRSGVRTSLLSVSGQAGLDHSGFAPVGEVMGCVVEHIGWQGYGGCGLYPGYGMAMAGYARTQTSGQGGFAGFAPYVDALNAGWDGAIGRMLTECGELGGDGVIGVRLQERHLGEGNREFVTLGTAVRSLGDRHTDRPFSTTLDGQDVVKLMQRAAGCRPPSSSRSPSPSATTTTARASRPAPTPATWRCPGTPSS